MFHVYPLNDEQEHELEGTCCPCQPEVDWGQGIVTHNAFDGRECVEQAEEIKKQASSASTTPIPNPDQQSNISQDHRNS